MPVRNRRRRGLLVERDADYAAQIADLAALFWIGRDVDLALRRAVAAEAGGAVIFRHRRAMGVLALGRRLGGKDLILRPRGQQQLLADHAALPVVRLGF